jgi:hypothetical protein
MSFEDHLREDLQVPETLVPPANLADTALARARRARRRTAVAASGAALVLVVGGASAPAWLPRGGGGAPPGAPVSCASRPLPALAASPTRENFDPLRLEIDAGAVLDFSVSSVNTGKYVQQVSLTNRAGDRILDVTLYATNGVPTYRTGGAPATIDPAIGLPAERVNGTPAYWLPDPTNTGLPQQQGLAWQWSPGAWVFVTAATNIDPATSEGSTVDYSVLRELVAQVAPALVLGGGTPVTSPFSLPVPACTRVVGTRLLHGTAAGDVPFTRFGLIFGPDDYADPTNPLLISGNGGQPITIDSDDHASPPDKPGSVNSTVDGHPAADGSTLVVFDVDGLAFELTGPPGTDRSALISTISIYSGAWGPAITP